MLNGVFYLQAAALFLTAIAMALARRCPHHLRRGLGIVLLHSGLERYYQQRRMEM